MNVEALPRTSFTKAATPPWASSHHRILRSRCGLRNAQEWSHSRQACVLFNQGNGTFGQPILVAVEQTLAGTVTGIEATVIAADANGDGRADLFIGSFASVYLAYGQADRTFGPPMYEGDASSNNGFILGQFQGDGTFGLVWGGPPGPTLICRWGLRECP